MKRQLVLVFTAGAALLGGTPTAVGADEVLLRLSFPPRALAMADGRIVWSQYETRNEETRPRLYTWKDGRTTRLPIVLDEASWAIDLGRNARGHQVLTFSFCDVGCRLYEYEFRSKRKRRLRRSVQGFERDPTRWGRYLAWTHTPDTPSASPRIFIKRLPNGRARRLPGGPRPRCRPEGTISVCRPYGGVVREIDLRRRTVAYTWSAEGRRRSTVAVRLVDRRGQTRTVASRHYDGNDPGAPSYFSPQFGAERLLAGFRIDRGSRSNSSLVAYSGGRSRHTRAPDAVLDVGPFGRRSAYFVAENYWRDKFTQDGCPCEVRLR